MLVALDHLGIAVDDLGSATRALELLLERPAEAAEVPSAGLEARSFDVSGVEIELLRTSDPPEGLDPRVFEVRPGVQHLAFRVADLEPAIARLAAAGVEPLRGFPRQGLHGRVAFFEDPVTGGPFELVEVPSIGAASRKFV